MNIKAHEDWPLYLGFDLSTQQLKGGADLFSISRLNTADIPQQLSYHPD